MSHKKILVLESIKNPAKKFLARLLLDNIYTLKECYDMALVIPDKIERLKNMRILDNSIYFLSDLFQKEFGCHPDNVIYTPTFVNINIVQKGTENEA